MKEELKSLAGHDGYMFFPESAKDLDNIKVEAFNYSTNPEYIPGTSMGELYEIVLMITKNCVIEKVEKFEAIIGNPLEYIEMLSESDIYGLVARKTKTSGEDLVNGFEERAMLCLSVLN